MKNFILIAAIVCVTVIIVYVCYSIVKVINNKMEFAYKTSELAISNESKKADVNAIKCDDYKRFPERKEYLDKNIDIYMLENVYQKAYKQGFEDCKSKVNGILN